MNKLRSFIFLGAPGVGKGTFSKIICKELDYVHIAIGDVIRSEINNQHSKFGSTFQTYVKNGELIPDALVNDLALDRVKSSMKPVILDGYPRNLEQAIKLDEELKTSNHVFTAVNIVLDRDVAIEKILGRIICKTCKDEFNAANICNNGYQMPAILPNPEYCKLGKGRCNFIEEKRVDDTVATISKRFEEFEKKTQPLLNYYSSLNKMITFNVMKGVKDAPDLIKLMQSH